MKISIPDFALVVLIGPTGSGKSTFARKHFLDTEIVSSDRCRALVCDDETDQSSTRDAFELLNTIAGIRLRRRKLTVIDATSVQKEDRAKLVRLARQYHALPVALVLDIDPEICHERNRTRSNRDYGIHVPRNHSRSLRRGLRGLQKEGFRRVEVMRTPQEVDALEIERAPLWTDQRALTGPFDIIGDVHGCFEELSELLTRLGYRIDPHESGAETPIGARHPDGRIAFFVGDITDRGPRNVDCLRLVMGMCAEGSAQCVMGNHDAKLGRWLAGRKVQVRHGLETTVAELETTSDGFRKRVVATSSTPSSAHYAWLDEGRLVVSPRRPQRRAARAAASGRGPRVCACTARPPARPTSSGCPCRYDWARDYRGRGRGGVRPHPGGSSWSGSMAPCASTPAACSAATSPRCATRNKRSYRSRCSAAQGVLRAGCGR